MFVKVNLQFLIFMYLTVFLYANDIDKECKNKNVNYQDYLGTKTGYRFLANFNDTSINISDCQPIRIWMITRHGTRYPGVKKIKKMQEVLSSIRDQIIENSDRGTLCNEEIELFQKWRLMPQIADDKNLSHEGEDEMLELAERMQNRFPTLFPQEYSNTSYFFKYTATQRCAESARYFTIGLFGRKISRYVWFPEPLYKDPVLRFYKACDKWRKTVKKNPNTYNEIVAFEKSNYVKNVQNQVTQRLGLTDLISVDTLKLMYTACGFEIAWSFRESSPWCSVFSKESLEVMEYLDDLKHYWVDGYGHELTKHQACPVLKEIYEYFDRKESSVHTVVYFTHSGTMLKLLSHLGLYYDANSLRHDNFEENKNRQWKVSKIDAFGSNLAFVLYNCTGIKKILLLHQERPIQIPGCPDNELLCPLDIFKNVFHYSILECNFDEICTFQIDQHKKKQKYK